MDKLFSKARVLEASENQAEGMEQANTLAETIQLLQKKHHKYKAQSHSSCLKSPCVSHQCGFTWPHKGRTCPAKGKTCKKCGKLVHPLLVINFTHNLYK